MLCTPTSAGHGGAPIGKAKALPAGPEVLQPDRLVKKRRACRGEGSRFLGPGDQPPVITTSVTGRPGSPPLRFHDPGSLGSSGCQNFATMTNLLLN